MNSPAETKKVLVTATYGPANPKRCPGAFVFATEAAKAGAQASLVFVLQAPLLLKKGVAEHCIPRKAAAQSENLSTRVCKLGFNSMPVTPPWIYVI